MVYHPEVCMHTHCNHDTEKSQKIMDEDKIPEGERPLLRAISRLPKPPEMTPEFKEQLLRKIKAESEKVLMQRQRNVPPASSQDRTPPQGK
jgi:hypothetical protein